MKIIKNLSVPPSFFQKKSDSQRVYRRAEPSATGNWRNQASGVSVQNPSISEIDSITMSAPRPE
jgi:hypothetical protein